MITYTIRVKGAADGTGVGILAQTVKTDVTPRETEAGSVIVAALQTAIEVLHAAKGGIVVADSPEFGVEMLKAKGVDFTGSENGR